MICTVCSGVHVPRQVEQYASDNSLCRMFDVPFLQQHCERGALRVLHCMPVRLGGSLKNATEFRLGWRIQIMFSLETINRRKRRAPGEYL